LGYSYVDAELTADFLRPTGTVIATDGNKLPGVPSHTFNVAVDHKAELSNKVTLVTRVDGYAQSSSENYIDNSHATFGDEHSGFSIWNASTTFEFDDFSVALFAKNLFNSEGVTATFSEAYMGTSPAQNYFGSGAKREITLPRTFGAALTYDF
jgi:outer membrane receptor for ferrienterochelin and colicin